MSVAGKVVAEGVKEGAEAVVKTGFLRGIAARASKLLGGGGAAVAGGSAAGEIGAAVVHEGADVAKTVTQGRLLSGAVGTGVKVAAIAAVAYAAWKGVKWVFGSKDEEPKQMSPEAQMINAPVTQPQGEWAARVGGSRGAMQGSYADAVRAEQSGGYYPTPQ
jgi:hypothetical protein